MADRTILHCDLNAFYASVECLAHPELRDVPMAVCGDPENRHGIILAKNELAKRRGVVTAETLWQAKRKCPELVLVPPHHDRYREYSRRVYALYGQYTDLVEPFGLDECWLDVTGSLHLFGSGPDIADTLRRRVREELGLTISVGVSFNKVFAKLGSDYKKPDATTVITRDNFREILFPLPVTALLYVGPSPAAILNKNHIRTIGDLAISDRRRIIGLLGRSGGLLWDCANGLDDSPVRGPDQQEPPKSVGNSITFRRNLVGVDDIRAGIRLLAESVATRLRADGLRCATVQVQIKDPALKVISRQKALPRPTHLAREIADAALALVLQNWDPQAPIRMLGVTGTHLSGGNEGYQLSLLDSDAPDERQERLETTIDNLRRRFGHNAVSTGALLATDIVAPYDPEDADSQ